MLFRQARDFSVTVGQVRFALIMLRQTHQSTHSAHGVMLAPMLNYMRQHNVDYDLTYRGAYVLTVPNPEQLNALLQHLAGLDGRRSIDPYMRGWTR